MLPFVPYSLSPILLPGMQMGSPAAIWDHEDPGAQGPKDTVEPLPSQVCAEKQSTSILFKPLLPPPHPLFLFIFPFLLLNPAWAGCPSLLEHLPHPDDLLLHLDDLLGVSLGKNFWVSDAE